MKMFSGSDGETIRNPYYMTKSEFFQEIENGAYGLSNRKDFCKEDCMKALKIIQTTLFDKLDKINKK